jgi:metal-responsive CopG/Arc/MetJ family transcriptional regulator
MKNLSLKLEEGIFGETEKIVSRLKKSRNKYINEAIDFYNKYHRRKMLEKRIARESKAVREDSMDVLKEFEAIDHAG